MLDFELNATNSFTIIFSSSGSPVTGISVGDVTTYYSLNGGSATQYTLSSSEFTEIDSSTMEGLYFVEISDSNVFSSTGEIIFEFDTSNADRYLVRGQIGSTTLSGIKSVVDDTNNIVSDIQTRTQTIKDDVREVQGTGFTESDDALAVQSSRFQNRVPGEVAQKDQLVNGSGTGQAPTDTGIWDVLGDGSETIPQLGTRLDRVLGLSQENYRIFDHSYDANNNLTSATIRIYQSKADTLNDQNPVAEYEMEADYSSGNRLTDYRMYDT